MSRVTWHTRWNPRSAWKGTPDYRAYRDDVVATTLQLVADWRRQRPTVSKRNRNLAGLLARLDLLVVGCEAEGHLPPSSNADLDQLAWDLGDLLSVLPQTDCWAVHGNGPARTEKPPAICEGCPFIGPTRGMSGDSLYYGCDALAFIGEKIVEWRTGFPANPWPDPGVWYSAFESDRTRH